MVTPKPKFSPGQQLNGSTVIEYTGRTPHSSRQGFRVNNYRLRCRCGETFSRTQPNLVSAIRRGSRITCGCRGVENNYQPGIYTPMVPCVHNWGYNPRA
jgi:hypothetical protein